MAWCPIKEKHRDNFKYLETKAILTERKQTRPNLIPGPESKTLHKHHAIT